MTEFGDIVRMTERVTAVIPAHNEEASIGATIQSIRANGVNRIIAVLDNCTDNTGRIALAEGAECFETVNNVDKKAGALNQALTALLTTEPDDHLVLVTDADTEIAPEFIATALHALSEGADAVGGVFKGSAPRNLIEACQANEYARYAREIDRTRRVMVLSGTASLIPVGVLLAVREARGSVLPGAAGDVYDRAALTEDNELTLALKTLGYRLASPEGCGCTTELMPTVSTLHRQRVRWYRGAVENLRVYGWSPVTRRYWFQQFMLTYGSLAMGLFLVVTTVNIVLFGFATSPLWIGVTVIFGVERVVTVWSRVSWSQRLLSALIVPELVYSMALYAAFIAALVKIAISAEAQWTHGTTTRKVAA